MNELALIQTRGGPGLAFEAPVDLSEASLDVQFDNRRVWSVRLEIPPRGQLVELALPDVLWPYLNGITEVSLARSSDGMVLVQSRVTFGDGRGEIRFVDERGIPLVVNKWGWLAPTIASDDSVRSRLVGSARELVGRLEQWGLRPFLSSGSLLGSVRNGQLLPHDDDIDIGLLSQSSSPTDVVLESLDLERRLKDAGYAVVRHSYAHLQLVFDNTSGGVDHCIDLFTAFFDAGGIFNQPFSIRAAVPRAKIEPFMPLPLEGVEFPAPASPETWLELNYGPNWEVPDPAFQFSVPESLNRRFECQFGSFNVHRDYWTNAHGEQLDGSPGESRVLEALRQRAGEGATVLDLGCGLSNLLSRAESDGFRSLAVDYSLPALKIQRRHRASSYVNFNDRRSVMELASGLLAAGEVVYPVLNHTLEGLVDEARENVVLLLSWVLHSDACAIVTLDIDPCDTYRFQDPRSWHMTIEALETLAGRRGLEADVVQRYECTRGGMNRSSALVVLRPRRGGPE